MKIRIAIAVIAALCSLARCGGSIAENASYNEETVAADQENSLEDVDMKREFCTVTDINDAFVIKNTAGETYRLDLSWGADFKEGDQVLLIYTERTRIGEGVYQADVYAVYEDDSTLQMPANQGE